MKPRAMILFATGTNRDIDAASALEQAGAAPEIVPINLVKEKQKRLEDYEMLVLPGGFSYADALGAGKLLALDLQAFFADQIRAFVEKKKPVIGICNGFQALVKAGILPGVSGETPRPQATLTFNSSGQFECRWVTLAPSSQKCVWTRGLQEAITCPVAHGEGNFVTASVEILNSLEKEDQIALTYIKDDGTRAGGSYPANPNGSQLDIAGICNPAGNVLGLMPHPEDHIFSYQHPHRTSGNTGGSGLALFRNGVSYCIQS